MVDRNSTYKGQLKLGSTRAPPRVFRLAPASRPCWIPPFKKARVPAYSRIFQPLPPGGRGVSNGEFYTALSARPATGKAGASNQQQAAADPAQRRNTCPAA